MTSFLVSVYSLPISKLSRKDKVIYIDIFDRIKHYLF